MSASSTATPFTIGTALLTITARNQSVCFGTEVATVTGAGTYDVMGYVNNEASYVISGTVTYITTYTSSTAAGTSSITISPALNMSTLSASNYRLSAATGTITVNPTLTASVAITASPSGAICPGTSVTFTASPTNGGTSPSYQWEINGNNVGTGTTYTSSALANNDVVTVVMTSNATPCLTSSPATSNSIAIVIQNTWLGTTDNSWNTASNWSCGSVPTGVSNVGIASVTNQPIIASDITINSLTINSGASLTVPTGFNLTVTDIIQNNGTMTVENNANLLQDAATTTNGNTGNIIVKRNSAPLLRLDHTLWSSPVTGSQTLQQFSPATLPNRFYTYTTSSNSYSATPATATFTSGKGYGIRASNTHSSTILTPFSGTFTGVPNNGTIPFTLSMNSVVADSYNLVGNPYPSPISVAAFLAENSSKIDGTLYFYAHTLTMLADGSFPLNSTNYSAWNNGTGTAATRATTGDYHTATPTTPNGIVQVGQGFIIQATAPGIINFTNAMRVGNNDNQFFRTTEIEKHRLWLNLATEAGADINQIAVAYVEGATQAADTFDGLSFGNTGGFLSSKINGADYVIQGRGLPFDSNDIVTLGFKATTAGNYQIILTNKDGLFLGNQDVFVRDNVMGIEHNIKVSPYVFTSAAGTFDARFQLVYTQMLGTPSTGFTPNSVIVYKNPDWFHVNTRGITMKSIQVFDISGRLIFKQSDINASETVLRGLTKTNEVLFLKITSEDNVTVTVKVIN